MPAAGASAPWEARKMISKDQLDHWFTYHAPTGQAQLLAYQKIRDAGRLLAETIVEHAPLCADQSAAIRKVREAVMTANAAIACEGR